MHNTSSPDTSDAGTERLLASGHGLRVALSDIENNIASEYYFTAADAVQTTEPIPDSLNYVTFCVLVLKNGYRIVGVNEGPVSADTFNADLGRRFAREKATDQIWPLMGYQLRNQLFLFES